MLGRALSLAAIENICCVIADPFLENWLSVYRVLEPENRCSLSGTESVVQGLARCLKSIDARDPKAGVIVIPYNHCAVEEVSWLDSTKGAVRLGSRNRNTVYLLHDNPENDPRVALEKPGVCTSSVMIGSSSALLALCLGKLATTVVDLVADPPGSVEDSAAENSADLSVLNVVHVREIEEYARLQRTDVWHRPSRQVDAQA
jgi:hypothetical protein